ncbi:hypothetical protein BC831DRAFT_268394 [Entophlyctis helioformis]|nr:hypothetical protein BC831DRAFT_268394 [Entophlyctis helioformis]
MLAQMSSSMRMALLPSPWPDRVRVRRVQNRLGAESGLVASAAAVADVFLGAAQPAFVTNRNVGLLPLDREGQQRVAASAEALRPRSRSMPRPATFIITFIITNASITAAVNAGMVINAGGRRAARAASNLRCLSNSTAVSVAGVVWIAAAGVTAAYSMAFGNLSHARRTRFLRWTMPLLASVCVAYSGCRPATTNVRRTRQMPLPKETTSYCRSNR